LVTQEEVVYAVDYNHRNEEVLSKTVLGTDALKYLLRARSLCVGCGDQLTLVVVPVDVQAPARAHHRRVQRQARSCTAERR
jgi:hypothetical protein